MGGDLANMLHSNRLRESVGSRRFRLAGACAGVLDCWWSNSVLIPRGKDWPTRLSPESWVFHVAADLPLGRGHAISWHLRAPEIPRSHQADRSTDCGI